MALVMTSIHKWRRGARSGLAVALVVLASCAGPPDSISTGTDAALDGSGSDARLADATVDACTNVDAGGAADLVLLGERTLSSITLQERPFEADSCAIVEGCVGGPGVRALMRFDTVIHNRGSGNLVVGPPDPDDARWEYSPCHRHYHFNGVATYELLDASGVVASGHKQAFCLVDTIPIDPGAGCASYTCNDQGIAAGWADIYGRSLDCQWIDITGLPAGAYTLRVRINPEQVLPEADFSNNVYETEISLP
jgi:hypothetical protein